MPTEKMADQIFEEIPIMGKKFSLKEKYLQHKVPFIATGALLFLLLLLITLSVFLPKSTPPVLPPASPTPTPTPLEEKITSPSAYATDSAVLKIESDLKTLDQNLQATDLKEAALNPPVLDMEVNFNEK